MRKSRKIGVAAIVAVTCAVLLTAGVAAAVLSDGESANDGLAAYPDTVRIDAPGLDDSIASKEMAAKDDPDVDVESLLPFVPVSSVSGTVDGTVDDSETRDNTYWLDVLDPRSQIDEIVAIDSLEPLSDGFFWGVWEDRDPRASVTEIVGEIGGVKIAVVVGRVLSAAEAEAFMETISVQGSK